MKKLLFTLCCMIFAIASFAQSNVHIKFMGIPVIAEQEYSKVKNLLSQKYGSDSEDMYVGTKDGKEYVSFISANDEGEINGAIDLFITQDEESWIRAPYNYNLHIDYNDRINTNKHDNQQLDEI